MQEALGDRKTLSRKRGLGEFWWNASLRKKELAFLCRVEEFSQLLQSLCGILPGQGQGRIDPEGRTRDHENDSFLEAELEATAFSTEDRHEGMNAFVEKRKPGFKGE